MEMGDNKPTGGRSDVLSTSHTGREILSSRISGKRAEHSCDHTNAQAVAVNDQPGVEKKSREERVSSLWGIQQGKAPKADAAQIAQGVWSKEAGICGESLERVALEPGADRGAMEEGTQAKFERIL